MALHEAGVIAGSVSTMIFVASYLPMLVKAARTKDLRSYSPANLVVASIGNLIHTVYVLSLPPGPLWLLHGFYLTSTALMLFWWWRYRDHVPEATTPGAASADGPDGVSDDGSDDAVLSLERVG